MLGLGVLADYHPRLAVAPKPVRQLQDHLPDRLRVLLLVLGFSRLLWLRFFARQDMRTLFQGLAEAFTFFGGVPRELQPIARLGIFLGILSRQSPAFVAQRCGRALPEHQGITAICRTLGEF